MIDPFAFMNRLSGRERKILYVVLILIVGVVSYHGIWTPVTEKMTNLDNEIFRLQMKVRKAKILIRQKEDILKEAENFQNLEQMDAGTDEEEIAQLLNFIEKTARSNSVSLSDVQPQQVQSDKWSKRYVVELNAESGTRQLLEFLYALKYSQQMLKIERVDVSPKEDQSRIVRAFLIVTRVVVQ